VRKWNGWGREFLQRSAPSIRQRWLNGI
jgi:hypothetical protein